MSSLITFQDFSGYREPVSLPDVTSADALLVFAHSLEPYSNAVVVGIQPTLPVTPLLPPVDAPFNLTVDKAVLSFWEVTTYDYYKLSLPAPKEAFFEIDMHGNRRVPEATGNAIAAEYSAAIGKTLHFLRGEYLSKPRWKISWNEIDEKPDTFPPDPHTHPLSEVVTWNDISGKPATYPPDTHSTAWADITGKPATYAPSAHTHSEYALLNHVHPNIVEMSSWIGDSSTFMLGDGRLIRFFCGTRLASGTQIAFAMGVTAGSIVYGATTVASVFTIDANNRLVIASGRWLNVVNATYICTLFY